MVCLKSVIVLLPILFALALGGGYGGGGGGGQSSSSRKQDDSGNYAFNYDITDPYGAMNSRQESGDVYGNKAGSYSIMDTDGRMRVVDYVADKQGFRAKIRSNEPGVVSSEPADAWYTAAQGINAGGQGRKGGPDGSYSYSNGGAGQW